MVSIYTKGMVCIYCGQEMVVDDIDYNFNGNEDDYLICPTCGASCIAKIRYQHVCKTTWNKNEENE